jgi:hypothetical protein
MGILSSFIDKTLDAVKNGKKLSEKEVKVLENVLNKRAAAIQVATRAFAAAIIMSSKEGETLNRSKIKKFSVVLDTVVDAAIRNYLEGRQPFSDGQRKKLVEIFNEMGLNGDQVAAKFIANFDILHGEVLKENLTKVESHAISEARIEAAEVPIRPIMPAEKEKERGKETEKRV